MAFAIRTALVLRWGKGLYPRGVSPKSQSLWLGAGLARYGVPQQEVWWAACGAEVSCLPQVCPLAAALSTEYMHSRGLGQAHKAMCLLMVDTGRLGQLDTKKENSRRGARDSTRGIRCHSLVISWEIWCQSLQHSHNDALQLMPFNHPTSKSTLDSWLWSWWVHNGQVDPIGLGMVPIFPNQLEFSSI